ncbi:MAG: radical SAM protein [Acidimicrobiales bacterium]
MRALRPDVVAFTATTPLFNQVRDMSWIVKGISPDIVTIAGGAHPTALPELSLRQARLDLVAVGEADFLLADLLDGRDPSLLGGVARLVDDAYVPAVPGHLLEDLDHLPLPAWDAYPGALDQRMSRVIARHQPVTTMEFSRGCLFRCDFCASKNTMGYGYRKKSPERCAEELVRLGRLGFREVILTDDIFTSDAEWASAVCEEIIRRKPGVAWTCSNGIRVDSTDTDLFPLLRAAGCYRVCFGFESGNDEVLRSFGKGGRASLDQGRAAVRAARAAGLEPDGLFMVGLSADTEASMADTLAFAKEVELDAIKCGICTPYPGTPYFDQLHASGRIRTYDWDAYSVWNKAEAIYEHPTLSWPTIIAAFDRFYSDAYLRNPRYLLRRARFILRNRELWENVRFTLEGWRAMRAGTTDLHTNAYRHEQGWRPSDASAATEITPTKPPKAATGTGPTGRNNRVVLAPRSVAGHAAR